MCNNTIMDALIDEALATIMHSAIWRSTWHMSLTTLLVVAIVAFLLLAYRRRKRGSSRPRRRFRYRSRYRD